MQCATLVSYTMLFNDSHIGHIIHRSGLRQGCPLSPYLFILCAEGLSSLIRRDINYGVLHGGEDLSKCSNYLPLICFLPMIVFSSFEMIFKKREL